jgi:hypothetical protein
MEECLSQLQDEQGLSRWVDGKEGSLSRDDPRAVACPAWTVASLCCSKAFSEHCGLAVNSEKSRGLSEVDTPSRRPWYRQSRRPGARGTQSALFLQLIPQPQTLSSALGKVHRDTPHVAKGPCACVFVPKLIAEGQGNFSKHDRSVLASTA